MITWKKKSKIYRINCSLYLPTQHFIKDFTLFIKKMLSYGFLKEESIENI